MEELFWRYLIYGFFGFLLEVALAKATRNPKQDRKCHLLLPVCPVYGAGAVLIAALPPAVKAVPWLLLLAGAGVATAAEWAFALFYERLGAPFWDYHSLPLNLKGRVCLLFSLVWGGLALPLVYLAEPLLPRAMGAIPAQLTLPTLAFYLGDAILSLALLHQGGTDALRWPRLFPRRVHS